jgi:hypothetical protein
MCYDVISVAMPTHRSGACETWVHMGPHQPRSWRSLSSLKWTQHVRSPVDLEVDPETLSTIPTTLEDPGQLYLDLGGPAGLAAQGSPLGHGTTPPVGPQIARFTL